MLEGLVKKFGKILEEHPWMWPISRAQLLRRNFDGWWNPDCVLLHLADFWHQRLVNWTKKLKKSQKLFFEPSVRNFELCIGQKNGDEVTIRSRVRYFNVASFPFFIDVRTCRLKSRRRRVRLQRSRRRLQPRCRSKKTLRCSGSIYPDWRDPGWRRTPVLRPLVGKILPVLQCSVPSRKTFF